MEKYESNDSVKAGYRIDAEDTDVRAQLLIDNVTTAAKDGEMLLNEYPGADPEEMIRKEDLAGFVVFENDGKYSIYENGDRKYEAKALDYLISSVDVRTAQFMLDACKSYILPKAEISLAHPEYMEPIDSSDYYGIVEVVYFGWCAVVCGAGIFTAERKYHIGKKLKVSGLSEIQLFLGKFIPMLLVLSIFYINRALTEMSCMGRCDYTGSAVIYCVMIILVSSCAAVLAGNIRRRKGE